MIRVLLVDDEQIVREGIRAILESTADITVVGELPNGAGIVEIIKRVRPDIVLMDLTMPGVGGIEAIALIGTLQERAPAIIVLTTFDSDKHIIAALQAGAVGFLRKSTSTASLLGAIHSAVRGDAILAPGAVATLLGDHTRDREALPDPSMTVCESPLSALTHAERRIVRAVAAGLSNSQIAAQLVLSEATVKSYVSRILGKLSVSNRVQLALMWWQENPPAIDPRAQ